MVLAQEEAKRMDHGYIGTEHQLLGLIKEGEGVAAKALLSFESITYETVSNKILELVGRGETTLFGHIPFTPRAKKVFELSLREALQLGHNYIGTEHVLLGMVREGSGVACTALQQLGVQLPEIRRAVLDQLAAYRSQHLPPFERPAEPARAPEVPSVVKVSPTTADGLVRLAVAIERLADAIVHASNR